MVSKLELLEQRLSRMKVNPTTPGVTKDVRPILDKELSLYTAVNYVHELANELWKDAQIFGPHQSSEETSLNNAFPSLVSPEMTKGSGRMMTSTPKKSSRTGELFSELDEVRMENLEKIATVYCDSLDSNLCLNLLGEVELWLQLLTENYDSSLSSFAPKDQAFSTISARVYFVSKVLEAQMPSVLMHIDSQICHLLYKTYPKRVPKILRKQLEKIVSIHQDISRKVNSFLHGSPTATANVAPKDDRVTFQQETDGRSNFLNQSDFHAFCKQRDVFYSIKDAWMSSHVTTNQQFSKGGNYNQSPLHPTSHGFSGGLNTPTSSKRSPHQRRPHHQQQPSFYADPLQMKMRQLMQLNSSPTNVSRLAALCLSQYLLDCANFKDYGMIQVTDENLKQIFQSNPSKFKQLENRFPKPVANDPLTFFKFFVDLASWSEFNQHLQDKCVSELCEIETSTDRQDVRHVKEIIDVLNKARLIAQILGYLHFRPYRYQASKKSNTIEFETYLQRQIQLRQYQQPPIDIVNILYKSLTTKKLVFTLPWILEFLSQADEITFHLPSYQETLYLVSQLYRTVLSVSQSASPKYNVLAKSNQCFLRFYCCNLFKRHDFPARLIFDHHQQYSEDLNLLLSGAEDAEMNYQDEEDTDLDANSLLGDALNAMLFEHQMTNLKNVLSTGRTKLPGNQANNSKSTPVNVLPVKHIRPITLNGNQKPDIQEPLVTEQLQHQLESSFFHNHPPSVKRTVDFISDRIASNFVRHVRLTLYPQCRDDFALQEIYDDEASRCCQEKALEVFKEVYMIKSNDVVQLLLLDSLSEGALEACKHIASRKATDKVCDWIETHINKDLFISPAHNTSSRSLNTSFSSPQKEFCSPLNRSALGADSSLNHSISFGPKSPNPKSFFQSSPPKFKALIILQQILQKIFKRQLQTTDICQILLPVLNPENLGNNCPQSASGTVDVALSLVTFYPEIFTTEVQDKFISFWAQIWTSHLKILCPRNILLFEQSNYPVLTWNKVFDIVNQLIKAGVINLKDMEDQCLGFLRHDWPPGVLARISEFSKKVSGSSGVKSEESEVIDWIAWACSDGTEFQ